VVVCLVAVEDVVVDGRVASVAIFSVEVVVVFWIGALVVPVVEVVVLMVCPLDWQVVVVVIVLVRGLVRVDVERCRI